MSWADPGFRFVSVLSLSKLAVVAASAFGQVLNFKQKFHLTQEIRRIAGFSILKRQITKSVDLRGTNSILSETLQIQALWLVRHAMQHFSPLLPSVACLGEPRLACWGPFSVSEVPFESQAVCDSARNAIPCCFPCCSDLPVPGVAARCRWGSMAPRMESENLIQRRKSFNSLLCRVLH